MFTVPPLFQLILNKQKTGYLVVDKNLMITESGGDQNTFAFFKEETLQFPESLLDFIPELYGYEEYLSQLFEGKCPEISLDNINKTTPANELHYVNLTILPFHRDNTQQETNFILVLISDVTPKSTIQQTLKQQRNELILLRQDLKATNERLRFIVQHYIPFEVGKNLLENKTVPKLGGIEREVTVLFADLRNFTSTCEKLHPQKTVHMLDIYLDIATKAISLHGGVIVNYMGDAIMAVFNAPNEQKNHAERAVKAGLRIKEKAMNTDATSEGVPSLYFGIGINTGIATIGNIGAEWHYQYTAIGDMVNVASRICGQAKENEVLIGEQTLQYIKNDVTAIKLPPTKLKGKSDNMHLYQISTFTK